MANLIVALFTVILSLAASESCIGPGESCEEDGVCCSGVCRAGWCASEERQSPPMWADPRLYPPQHVGTKGGAQQTKNINYLYPFEDNTPVNPGVKGTPHFTSEEVITNEDLYPFEENTPVNPGVTKTPIFTPEEVITNEDLYPFEENTPVNPGVKGKPHFTSEEVITNEDTDSYNVIETAATDILIPESNEIPKDPTVTYTLSPETTNTPNVSCTSGTIISHDITETADTGTISPVTTRTTITPAETNTLATIISDDILETADTNTLSPETTQTTFNPEEINNLDTIISTDLLETADTNTLSPETTQTTINADETNTLRNIISHDKTETPATDICNSATGTTIIPNIKLVNEVIENTMDSEIQEEEINTIPVNILTTAPAHSERPTRVTETTHAKPIKIYTTEHVTETPCNCTCPPAPRSVLTDAADADVVLPLISKGKTENTATDTWSSDSSIGAKEASVADHLSSETTREVLPLPRFNTWPGVKGGIPPYPIIKSMQPT